MTRRIEMKVELKEIMSHDPTGDPHSLQMKRIQALNAEVLLDVVDTLEKIDKNNSTLGKSNLKIQSWMIALTILILTVAALTLLVATKNP